MPTSKPQPDGTLIKALARAWRWQRMLENSEDGILAELSAAERISRSYICRVLRLTLLAPLGHVDAAVGVDADQVIVEGGMVDLRTGHFPWRAPAGHHDPGKPRFRRRHPPFERRH